jgi:alkanesulfonate monooxygenase SsuD/methylene tetrahydromethanopterin reductase-like flavin-dependent oxidoreductase (luciferase family)
MQTVRERQAALEELLHILDGLWGSVPFSYQGNPYSSRVCQF